MKYFDLEFETAKPMETVHRELLSAWTGQLADNGYTLTSSSDVVVTFSRKYRSWQVILLAVLFFPLGLLFLLWTSEATITASIDQDDDSGGSVLIVNGKAPKNVRRGLESMQV